MIDLPKAPVVRHLSKTVAIPCPYGNTARVITGGEGGVANVHVITVTDGDPHFHTGYDEVYYYMEGSGTMTIDNVEYSVEPGSVAVIPRGFVHSIRSNNDNPLKFVIFGTPAMSTENDDFKPRRP